MTMVTMRDVPSSFVKSLGPPSLLPPAGHPAHSGSHSHPSLHSFDSGSPRSHISSSGTPRLSNHSPISTNATSIHPYTIYAHSNSTSPVTHRDSPDLSYSHPSSIGAKR